MLILTRQPGERIWIGKDIRIEITRVDGQNVKVGVDAPQSMKILREELRTEGDAIDSPRPAPLDPISQVVIDA